MRCAFICLMVGNFSLLFPNIGASETELKVFDNNISKSRDTVSQLGYVPGELIIKIKSDVLRSVRIQAVNGVATLGIHSLDILNKSFKAKNIRSAKNSVLKNGSTLDNVYIMSFDESVDIEKIGKIYAQDANIMYAEPNHIVRATYTPNDPYLSYQWHYNNSSSNDSDINLPEAWEYDSTNPNYGGDSSVVVAIIDTGVAYEDYSDAYYTYVKAPDLANTTFVSGYDFVNNDSHPNDDNSHGTHVAGTVAQSTNNSVGVAGIAFNASIMPIKALDASGFGTDTQIASAIDYARQNGAEIISMSLGGSSSSTTQANAIQQAIAAGIIIIAATGNDYNSVISYPAAYDGVIAVGATRYDATRSEYSNYGTGTDIVAPGGDTSVDQNSDSFADGVLQQTFAMDDPLTVFTDETDPSDFNYYFFQGTSMATPHVSGVAALLLAYGVPASNVDDVLYTSARDLGTAGYDTTYGYGLLDAEAALNYASSGAPSAPSISCLDSFGGSVVLQNDQRYKYTQPYCSWNTVGNATGYYVYFGTNESADPQTSGTLQTSTNYIFSAVSGNAQKYYLRVKSVGANGIISTVGSFTYIVDTEAAVPTSITTQGSTVGITVSWQSSVSDSTYGVVYSVLRSQSLNGAYAVLKSEISDATKSFLDLTPKIGKTYYYKVQATDDLSNVGVASSAVSARMPGGAEIIVGAASQGSPSIKVYSAKGSLLHQFYAYSKNFKGGVHVATGDLDGNGVEEIITGMGQTGSPQVKVFDSAGSAKLTKGFYAYSKGFKGGARVAAGDVDGDGIDEIITGAGPGGTPQVRVFSGTGAKEMTSGFYAYSKSFQGGVEVAAGDVDGDGKDEIITGSGSGTSPRVRVFDGTGKADGTNGFYAYSKNFKGGITVASKDINNDGYYEIITGMGPGSTPQIKMFNKTGQVLYKSFLAYGKSFKGGVYVSANDINGDISAEIITGPGAGGGPQVKGFNSSGSSSVMKAFFAGSKNFKGGIRVASGDVE